MHRTRQLWYARRGAKTTIKFLYNGLPRTDQVSPLGRRATRETIFLFVILGKLLFEYRLLREAKRCRNFKSYLMGTAISSTWRSLFAGLFCPSRGIEHKESGSYNMHPAAGAIQSGYQSIHNAASCCFRRQIANSLLLSTRIMLDNLI